MGEPTPKQDSPETGHVYFVQEGTAGPIKVGRADDCKHRLSKLQVGNPRRLYLLMVVPTAEPDRLEEEIHRRFADSHVRGEWFNVTKREVARIGAQFQTAEPLPLQSEEPISDEVKEAVQIAERMCQIESQSGR